MFTIGASCRDDGFELALLGSEFVKVCVWLSVSSINFFQTVFSGQYIAHTALNRLAHGVRVIEFGLLGQIANLDAWHGRGFAFDLGVDTCHDFEQGGLARTVQTQHTDLGAREKTQRNIFQDMALRRDDLAYAVHGENVLGHGVCSFGKQSNKTGIIPAPSIRATIRPVAAASCRNISTSAGADSKRLFSLWVAPLTCKHCRP